jgi:hypothetical protein
MKFTLPVILLTVSFGFAAAVSAQSEMGRSQENKSDRQEPPERRSFTFERQAVVTFSALNRDLAPMLNIRELPGPRKVIRPIQYPASQAKTKAVSDVLPPLVMGFSAYGNGFDGWIPNDNDLAISDSGWFVSVVNCQIFARNIKTGQSSVKSLEIFTSPVHQNKQEFDPKVIYDPEKNRFIIVTLAGFRDSTSKVIIGFSKTDNPMGQWNMYVLPGNPLMNNLWSDYPMIAMTDKELFLTVNLLYEDSTWQTGFVESLIWQVSKDSGYAGKNLATYLHSNIKYNSKPVRNICPVKGGSRSYGPEMYFLSNRNFAAQNDSVFLLKISNPLSSPTTSISISALKSSQPYYFPADGQQPLNTQSLTTNDSRNLGAFYENDRIQYVHNTNNPVNGRVTVYYGVISNVLSGNPSATGYIIPNGSMDYAYPNISYSGLDSTDNSAIISFDHSSLQEFAGCSAIHTDAEGSFSPIKKICTGTSFVNLRDTMDTERWGDYTGSQRRYSKPGEVWMSGFIGVMIGNYNGHRTWVAQLSTEKSLTVGKQEQLAEFTWPQVFPNPTQDHFTVRIRLPEPEYLNITLHDSQGKLTDVLKREWVRGYEANFSFRTADLPRGIYLLTITGNKTTNITQKIVVN